MTLGEVPGNIQSSAISEGLQGIIITDCSDPNALARQEIRFASLFGVTPAFVGLGTDNPDLEAAGHLVDTLDALRTPSIYGNTPAVVLVNVAPRGDAVRKKWENGTPFCHFEVNGAIVVSAYEGRALSLASKLGLVSAVSLLDIPEVTSSLVADRVLNVSQAETINNSQFRSLEFLPLAARELIGGRRLPAEKLDLEEHPTLGQVWFIDGFGNIKTTSLPEDIEFKDGKKATLAGGQEIACYRRLADVPTGKLGLTVGSSGYGNHRWLEIVRQNHSAASRLGVKVGRRVLAGC